MRHIIRAPLLIFAPIALVAAVAWAAMGQTARAQSCGAFDPLTGKTFDFDCPPGQATMAQTPDNTITGPSNLCVGVHDCGIMHQPPHGIRMLDGGSSPGINQLTVKEDSRYDSSQTSNDKRPDRDFFTEGTFAILSGLLVILSAKMVSNGVDVSRQSSNLGLVYILGAFISALVATIVFLLFVMDLSLFR